MREIDPHSSAGEAGVTNGFLRAGVAAGPSFVTRLPAQTAGCRLPRAEFGQPRIDTLQKTPRRVENPVDRAEKTGMASGAAQRERILVVHFAAHHAATPGAAFSGHGFGWVRMPGQA